MTFFQTGNPWFLVKKLPFFQLFFFGNIGQENIIYYILERKNVFLGYKNKTFRKSKIDIFPKGLTHGFAPKMAIFRTFFFGNIVHKNVLHDIQERKTLFLAIKTRCSKSRKIDIFPKGLSHGFAPNISIFPTFFFSQYQRGKCL